MTIELSRFVHSLDDALAELGAGRHRHPDPLARWYTLMARSRQKKNWSCWKWKRSWGADGSGDEEFLKKKVLVCIMGFDKIMKIN